MKIFQKPLDFFVLMRYNNQALLRDGRLAQLVELPLDVRKVTGSSPVPSTIRKSPLESRILMGFFFFCFQEFSEKMMEGAQKGAQLNNCPNKKGTLLRAFLSFTVEFLE